ncbi:MAG: LapA family protein [Rhodobacterales bacterium]|nr:LapA family protein [Rhodobacterales bacterium]
MIRSVRLLLLGVTGLLLLVVALANRAPVTIRFLSDDLAALTGFSWSAEVPLFLVIFAGIVAGVLIGFVWEWLREARIRGTATTKAREVVRLERELAALRAETSGPKDEVLALLELPKGR